MKNWSGKDFYIKHIEVLKAHEGVKRGSAYHQGHYSKYLMIDLPESNPADAIHFNGRLAETGEEAIVGAYTRAEARQLLRYKGFPRKNAEKIVQRMYDRGGDKSGTHYTSGRAGGRDG